jgi:hypothetical protein
MCGSLEVIRPSLLSFTKFARDGFKTGLAPRDGGI